MDSRETIDPRRLVRMYWDCSSVAECSPYDGGAAKLQLVGVPAEWGTESRSQDCLDLMPIMSCQHDAREQKKMARSMRASSERERWNIQSGASSSPNPKKDWTSSGSDTSSRPLHRHKTDLKA